MGYRSLQACLEDLSRTGQLLRLEVEVDPHLEAAEIHRRVHRAGGPAIHFARVKGCRFPMVSNLFGTMDRTRFIFRDALEGVRRLVRLKIDPAEALRHPLQTLQALPTMAGLAPRRVRGGPVLACETSIDQLPRQQSWPLDGGPFITLPQVYTEDVERRGWRHSNLGMYRVQLAGNRYEPNREIGLHYQIHRGIGVHHAAALRAGKPFQVNIFVGGPPAMSVAAVMPLPEGLPELAFAGALGRRSVRLARREGLLPIAADADFCICGTVDPEKQLPEGPFGDHLGYYSLQHDFPVLRVERVFHRRDAIWPFTVVGRPPQEDTIFGELIHELTGPIIPTVIPGVSAVHAVDAAGVHPLLLAIGSERYVPYAPRRQPQELLTQANAILGQGQMSLAKYLFIAARDDAPLLDLRRIDEFLAHVLSRVDWTRDIHFQTRTTIDTLDYSGSGFNEGSKAVIAAVGKERRMLATRLPVDLHLPEGFSQPRLVLPGVLAVQAPPYGRDRKEGQASLRAFCQALRADEASGEYPLLTLVDDSEFAARTLGNWLWTTFTRSDPACDIDGVESFCEDKHWGCRGPLVIDARSKPHHAPPLAEDPEVSRRVDALTAKGGPLSGIA